MTRDLTPAIIKARNELAASGEWPDTPNARELDAAIAEYQRTRCSFPGCDGTREVGELCFPCAHDHS